MRSPQRLPQEVDEPIAPVVVDAPHSPHVAHDGPVLDELRSRSLDDVVALAIDHEPLARQPLDDGGGGDDVSEAQTRGEHLGQAADVDHAAVVVRARQRQHGSALVVELVVVIVLDHRQSARGGRDRGERSGVPGRA